MRILVLTNLYPNPYQPGRATFNRQQLRHLAARHPVSIISPILWTEELAARWRGRAPLPPGRRVTCDGIPVVHPRYVYPPKILRSWYGRFFRWSVRAAFQQALAEFSPELIYAPWAYPDGWAAVELGQRAGLPVIIKVHGSDVLGLKDHPGRLGPTLRALRKADGIITVSQDLADRALRYGVAPERLRVIYDGVDAALFHPGSAADARAKLGLPNDRPLILFVGNLVPVKGIENLIDACSLLAGQNLPFGCYLVGRGPLHRRLEQRVIQHGLQDAVHLVGPVAHHDLPDWYRAADVFVLPSYSEGVPCVLLEAAACRTPFVATRVGGIPEIAHLGTSQLVEPGNAAALAQAIRSLLTARAGTPEPLHKPLRSHADAVTELTAFFDQVYEEHAHVRGAADASSPVDRTLCHIP